MSKVLAQMFSNIPQEELDIAIQCGLLLGAASSIFYFFFGKLLSIPELLATAIRNPTSTISRNSIVVISGFIFVSAILRVFYHQHITAYFPFDDEVYLRKISTLRLIVSGALVGVGSQIALSGSELTGVMGVPTLSLNSMLCTLVFFGSTMLTVTYKFTQYLPKTPRIIEIANRALPQNISFDAYLLVTLLIPFIVFLIAVKKTLIGMIECLTNFGIGIGIGIFLMLIGWSSIQKTYKRFSYSKNWTGQMIVAFAIACALFAFVYSFVRYLLKKPLFFNKLQERKAKISLKKLLGHALVGVGFGLGGLLFQSFLLTVPSSQIRIAVFWGLPCIFAMKAMQVLTEKSELRVEEKRP